MRTRVEAIRHSLGADLQALIERVGTLVRLQPAGVDVDIASATSLQDLLREAKEKVPAAILEESDAA